MAHRVTKSQGQTDRFARFCLSGGVKYTGGREKLAVLDRYHHLSQKLHEIDRPLLWINNVKSSVADRSVSIPITLSDLEKWDARDADLHN